MKTSIHVDHIKCEGCCNKISSELSKLDHISNVETNLSEEKVSFDYKDSSHRQKVIETLKTLGYPPKSDATDTSSGSKSFFNRMTNKFSK